MTKRKRADNVVTIHGAKIDRVSANKNVVALLKDALSRAKSGDIEGIAAVYQHSDGSTSFGHTGQYRPRLMAGTILDLLDVVRESE